MFKNQKFLIKNQNIKELYNIAKSIAVPNKINEQMSSGGVGAAILTKKYNKYFYK